MTKHYLDFEKPIAELEGKIEELRHLSDDDSGGLHITDEVSRLQGKIEQNLKSIYAKLGPWEKVKVARHPERPRCKDYVEALIEDFTPLAGDRLFGEDLAIISGMGRLDGEPVLVLGHERGGDTESRIRRNFGMARPEGYRKAQRLMDMADRFNLPVICLVDTPGAYPGVGAEERGQSEAIASTIQKSIRVGTPIVSVITGEGGSGGAVALATSNAIMMLEHSIYSVISPEGCASILWRSGEKAKDASESLRLTAQDLKELGVIDEIIPEPLGGAHRDPQQTIESVRQALAEQLRSLVPQKRERLIQDRRTKFLEMTGS